MPNPAVSFEFPDLTIWVPAEGAIPGTVTAAQFKRAVRQQGLSLADPAFRRDLIYRMCLGGMSERPYAETDRRGFSFRQRVGHDSAQARSRLLSALFKDDVAADPAAPMPDRVLVALHLMAHSFHGDVDWEHKGHRDFHNMLSTLFTAFTKPDHDRHAKASQAHKGSQLDLGATLLEDEYAAGRIASPSALAGAEILSHAYGTNMEVMLAAGPDGTRRLWRWLNLVMIDEPQGEPTQKLGLGRSAMMFNSGLPGTNWTALLHTLTPDSILDAPAVAVLSRFKENTSLRVEEKEIVPRLISAIPAEIRAMRASQGGLDQGAESRARPRHRP